MVNLCQGKVGHANSRGSWTVSLHENVQCMVGRDYFVNRELIMQVVIPSFHCKIVTHSTATFWHSIAIGQSFPVDIYTLTRILGEDC